MTNPLQKIDMALHLIGVDDPPDRRSLALTPHGWEYIIDALRSARAAIPEAFSGDAPVSKTGEQGSIPCGGANLDKLCERLEAFRPEAELIHEAAATIRRLKEALAAMILEQLQAENERLREGVSKITVTASIAHRTKRGSDEALDEIGRYAFALLQPKEQQS